MPCFQTSNTVAILILILVLILNMPDEIWELSRFFSCPACFIQKKIVPVLYFRTGANLVGGVRQWFDSGEGFNLVIGTYIHTR